MGEFWTQLFQVAGVGAVFIIAWYFSQRRNDSHFQQALEENQAFIDRQSAAWEAERTERQTAQRELVGAHSSALRENAKVMQELTEAIRSLKELVAGSLNTMRETTEGLFREMGTMQQQQRELNANALAAYKQMGDALATMSERIDAGSERSAATLIEVIGTHEAHAQERHLQLMGELQGLHTPPAPQPDGKGQRKGT